MTAPGFTPIKLTPMSVLSLCTKLSPPGRRGGEKGGKTFLQALRPLRLAEGVLPGSSWWHRQEEGTARVWEASRIQAGYLHFFIFIPHRWHSYFSLQAPSVPKLSLVSEPLHIFLLPGTPFGLIILTYLSMFSIDVTSSKKLSLTDPD